MGQEKPLSYPLSMAPPDTGVIHVGTTSQARDVLQHLRPTGGVIALLSATEGSFFRAPGAVMGFAPDGTTRGAISSGCVEADLAIHARACWQGGQNATLRYGRGSPFFDIVLSCGGSIEVRLASVSHPASLDPALTDMDARHTARLGLPGLPTLVFRPDPRFLLIGTAEETEPLHRLAMAAGYDVVQAADVDPARTDARTAIVILHHDHDAAIPQLRRALSTAAFWIGALGSHATQARRLDALGGLGVGRSALERLRGPIGLIAGARDARTLAVSVLADIVQAAR